MPTALGLVRRLGVDCAADTRSGETRFGYQSNRSHGQGKAQIGDRSHCHAGLSGASGDSEAKPSGFTGSTPTANCSNSQQSLKGLEPVRTKACKPASPQLSFDVQPVEEDAARDFGHDGC